MATGRAPRNTCGVHCGYVYLVLNPRTGFIKIDSARRPDRRLTAISGEMQAKCV